MVVWQGLANGGALSISKAAKQLSSGKPNPGIGSASREPSPFFSVPTPSAKTASSVVFYVFFLLPDVSCSKGTACIHFFLSNLTYLPPPSRFRDSRNPAPSSRPSSRHTTTRSGSSEQRQEVTPPPRTPPFASAYRKTTAAMPPKKVEKAPAKKVDVKKSVDDKTFGMKNKKGGAAQRQIKQIQAQAKSGGTAEQKKKDAEKAQREREKLAAEAAKREQEALLNKPAQIQKVPFGVDPKTVLCIFHKKGNCEKGKKCKFSHDLELDRKTEKKSLYQDTRQDEEETKKAETSADWDEEKLRSVVLSKKGNQRTSTDKVCKFFVQAIEDGKYGWFWICPNGGDKCMYKHALPPGCVVIVKSPFLFDAFLLTMIA